MKPSFCTGFMAGMRVERLDHLGIVAGVCQKIGLVEYLDALAGPSQQQVSVGTATVAMILNGLGFSNRRLYLVAQFFATKPVEYLLGPGITAEQLHDDGRGRTLDWLYAHDPTVLFAGIVRQAHQCIGSAARQVPLDTTSCSVSGGVWVGGTGNRRCRGADHLGDLWLPNSPQTPPQLYSLNYGPGSPEIRGSGEAREDQTTTVGMKELPEPSTGIIKQ